MSNQAVEVEILGKLTRVNCPPGEEESLIKAAQDLDTRLKDMTERTKVNNVEKLLTIAALNICYELQVSKEKADGKSSQITERMESLAASLDGALKQLGQQK
ncbi:cell division protein ZapA [Vibrio tapetis subsp. quintayensis]|uniref:cell division protein ZapA n=1 Tax=Vibrio tapetis TaxID=52443 RepID=UPI0025B4E2F0|nr:cell division protein ZapA [Vibrio tapetis]MDN3681704.1 cell division protein ZapA [Vibrio tapetis subsp. quintayensis]